MNVLVSGSSGLIGSRLVPDLAATGHRVTRLVRSSPGPQEVGWDPARGDIDAGALEGHDAVVHLAGAGIGEHRWTQSYKEQIRASRVEGTGLLARALAGLKRPPSVLASGSAVGVYGDRGDEELTESSPPGRGFLAEVVQAWEAATRPAEDAGIRVAHLRSGVVLSPEGGALRRQLTPFRLGLGGRLGSGRHYVSWITIDDEVGAIAHVLEHPDLAGPVNLTAPEPVTNAEFTRALGRVLRRPTVATVPRAALQVAFGREMTEQMLLASQRARPTRLEGSGFVFRHREVEAGLRALLQD